MTLEWMFGAWVFGAITGAIVTLTIVGQSESAPHGNVLDAAEVAGAPIDAPIGQEPVSLEPAGLTHERIAEITSRAKMTVGGLGEANEEDCP